MSDHVKDKYRNAVLDRPWAALLDFPHFDPSVQLPVELLHVVLLGLVKYLFRATINKLDERQKARLSARLSAADVDGLGLDSRLRGGYMVRHALSLNGKDFRALLAVVPSILPLVDTDDSLDSLSQAWLAAARLGSALYADSVERIRLDAYQTYVKRCISSIFHTLAKAAPELLWSKPKLHLLCHAAVHFAAFGPLSSVSAERFEAFNSIVRSAAVHSNRLRPSRDIANTILRQQDIRHVLGAGRMADGVAVGTSLRILLRSPEGKVLLRMYGLDSMKAQRLPGSTTPLADSKIVWTQLPGDTATRRFQQVSSVVLWDTRDLVSPDSAILVANPIGKDDEQQWTSLLLVEDILVSVSADPQKPVIIRASPLWPAHQDASEEDGLFEVIIGTEKQNVLLKDIVAVINLQHDCLRAKCRLRRGENPTHQRRTHEGDTLELVHSNIGAYTVSFAQLRSGYAIWPHIRQGDGPSMRAITSRAVRGIKRRADEAAAATAKKKNKKNK
ncbi:hypothetical protein CF319_g7831 [Tilletia indica]|nr:hypothetical protein CF319_g7831 [Tilletia indica]